MGGRPEHGEARRPALMPDGDLLGAYGGLRSVYQPIVDLTTGRVTAYEALARFGAGSPAAVFADARRRGRGNELEAEAIRVAFGAGAPPLGARLSVNMSPTALMTEGLLSVLPMDLSWVIVEITENDLVLEEDGIQARLDALRARGAQIAVDDAGAGYASMRQVMQLRPDIIKLDRALVTGVDADAAKRALVRAFVAFGDEIGSRVCAEGIEELAELRALADLDVGTGQGYALARPAPAWPAVSRAAIDVCATSLDDVLSGAEAGRRSDLESTLAALGRTMAACRSYAELEGCVETAQRLLDVPEISVSRVVEGPGIVACAGPRWASEPVYLLRDFPATADALARGRLLQVLLSDDGADPVERRLLAANGYGSLLLVPLRFRGQAVGIIEIFRAEDRPWSRRQIALARAVGHQLAMLLPHLEIPQPAGAAA
jgi:EAL domain-containing protein (putative c-di-GMP-specific phosphodiesterase class I)